MIKTIKKIFMPGEAAILIYRLSHIFKGKDPLSGLIRNILFRLNLILHGCEIHPEAVIGKGIFLHHTVGIVIGKSIIGDNVHIFQNVTIGGSGSLDTTKEGWPTIEDGVSIFAGAVVAGKITVGRSARIGANSVVLKDVPPYCLAVGAPARIITK